MACKFTYKTKQFDTVQELKQYIAAERNNQFFENIDDNSNKFEFKDLFIDESGLYLVKNYRKIPIISKTEDSAKIYRGYKPAMIEKDGKVILPAHTFQRLFSLIGIDVPLNVIKELKDGIDMNASHEKWNTMPKAKTYNDIASVLYAMYLSVHIANVKNNIWNEYKSNTNIDDSVAPFKEKVIKKLGNLDTIYKKYVQQANMMNNDSGKNAWITDPKDIPFGDYESEKVDDWAKLPMPTDFFGDIYRIVNAMSNEQGLKDNQIIKGANGTWQWLYKNSSYLNVLFPNIDKRTLTSEWVRKNYSHLMTETKSTENSPYFDDKGNSIHPLLNGTMGIDRINEIIKVTGSAREDTPKNISRRDKYELYIDMVIQDMTEGNKSMSAMLGTFGDTAQLYYAKWLTMTNMISDPIYLKTDKSHKFDVNYNPIRKVIFSLGEVEYNIFKKIDKAWSGIAGKSKSVYADSKKGKQIENELQKNYYYRTDIINGKKVYIKNEVNENDNILYKIYNDYNSRMQEYIKSKMNAQEAQKKAYGETYGNDTYLKTTIRPHMETLVLDIEDSGYVMENLATYIPNKPKSEVITTRKKIDKILKDYIELHNSVVQHFADKDVVVGQNIDPELKDEDVIYKMQSSLIEELKKMQKDEDFIFEYYKNDYENLFDLPIEQYNDDERPLKERERGLALKEMKSRYTNEVLRINDLTKLIKAVKAEISKQGTKYKIDKGYMYLDEDGTITYNSVIESIYWSHMLTNVSVGQMLFGTAYTYKDIFDYIKRGKGAVSDGETLMAMDDDKVNYLFDTTNNSKRPTDMYMKMIIIDDIGESNTLFKNNSDPEARTNGSIHINPLFYIKRKVLGGGNVSNIQKNAKTVIFNHDLSNDKVLYGKANEYKIPYNEYKYIDWRKSYEDNLREFADNYYASLFLRMNGKAMYDEIAVAIREYKRDNAIGMGRLITEDQFDEAIETMIYKLFTVEATYSKDSPTLKKINAIKSTIDMQAHPSSIKIGSKKVYKFENGVVDLSLHGDDYTTQTDSIHKISPIGYRVQQVTTQDTLNNSIKNPSQNENAISAMLYNIEAGIRSSVEKFHEEYMQNETGKLTEAVDGFISDMDNGYKQLYAMMKSVSRRKHIDVMNTGKLTKYTQENGFTPDVYRIKYIDDMAGKIKKAMEPRITGTMYLIAPAHMNIYEIAETGEIYTSSDYYMNNKPLNAIKRQLKPFSYEILRNGVYEEAKSLEELKQAINNKGKVRYRHAEIITSFMHRARYGISDTDTLNQVMKYNGVNFYQTIDDRLSKSREMLQKEMSDVIDALISEKSDIDVKARLYNGMHSIAMSRKVSEIVLREKLGKGNAKYYDNSININSKQSVEIIKNATVADVKSAIIKYYMSLNDALDIFETRIPTLNGANTMGRIIGFDHSNDNILYKSGQLNLLTDEDYDADQVAVLWKSVNAALDINEQDNLSAIDEAISKGVANTADEHINEDEEIMIDENSSTENEKEEKKKAHAIHKLKSVRNKISHRLNSNNLIDAIGKYYTIAQNIPNIISSLDIKTLRSIADDLIKHNNIIKNYSYYLASTDITMYDRIQSGELMIGHLANISKYVNKMLSLDSENRAELIEDKKYMPHIFDYDKNPDLHNNHVKSLDLLIQAATINLKEGGLLGNININEVTSPLISGIFFNGIPAENLDHHKFMIKYVEAFYKKIGRKTNENIIENILMKYVIAIVNSKEVLESTEKAMRADNINSFSKYRLNLENIDSDFIGEEEKEFYGLMLDPKPEKFQETEESKAEDIEKMRAYKRYFIEEIKKYNTMGTAMLRFGDVSSIPDKIKGDESEIIAYINRVESHLGINLEDIDKYSGDNYKRDNHSIEKQVEEALRITFTQTIDETDKASREVFNLPAYILRNERRYQELKVLRDLKISLKYGLMSSRYFYDNVHNFMDKTSKKYLTADNISEMLRELHLMAKDKFIYDKRLSVSIPSIYLQKFGLPDTNFKLYSLTDTNRFVYLMPQIIQQMRLKYTGQNDFLNAISGQSPFSAKYRRTDTGDIQMGIWDSINKNTMEEERIKRGYDKLDESDKEIIRLYDLIVNGFVYSSHIMTNMIDTKYDKMYSDYVKSNINKSNFYGSEITGNDTMSDYITYQLASRAVNVLNKESIYEQGKGNKSPSEIKSDIFNLNKYMEWNKGSNNIVMIKNDSFVPLLIPGSSWFSSYFKSAQENLTTEYINPVKIGIEKILELQKSGKVDVVMRNDKSVNKYASANSGVYVATVGQVIILSDGTNAYIQDVNGRNVKLKMAQNKNINVLEQKSVSEMTKTEFNKQHVMSLQSLTVLVDKIKQSVPWIRIEIMNSDNPLNIRPGSVAYTMDDGTIVVNPDLVRPDTMFHELMHVFEPIIEKLSPELHGALMAEAEEILSGDNQISKIINDNYSDYTHREKLSEVMGWLMGFQSYETVENFVRTHVSNNTGDISRSLWNRIKDIVAKIWKFLDSWFERTLDLQDASNMTLDDFRRSFINSIMSGTKMNIDGVRIDLMSYNGVLEQKNINNVNDLLEDLNTEDYITLNESEIIMLESQIVANNGIIPDDYAINNNTIKLSDDPAQRRKQIQELIRIKESNDSKVRDKILGILDDIDTVLFELDPAKRKENKDKLFDFLKDENEYIVENYIKQITASFNWNKKTKYITYEQLKNDPTLKHLYDPNIDPGNIIIGIDYNNTKTKKIMVSIYHIDNKQVVEYDHSKKKNNILSKYISNSDAGIYNISLTNTRKNVKFLALGLLAHRMVNLSKTTTGKLVSINNIAVINAGVKNVRSREVPLSTINPTIKGIGMARYKGKKFIDNIDNPEIKALFTQPSYVVNNIDYIDYMISYWNDSKKSIKVDRDNITPKELLTILQNRLSEITKYLKSERNMNSFSSSVNYHEMKMINMAIRQIKNMEALDDMYNPDESLSKTQTNITPTAMIADERVQYVRAIINDVAMNSVSLMQQTMKEADKVFKHFDKQINIGNTAIGNIEKVYKKFQVSVDGYASDKITKAKVYLPYLYWTTDINKDPVNAKKAQELVRSGVFTNEDLKQIEKLVDIWYEEAIQSVISRESRNNHEFFETMKREDAEKLLKKTYRKGQIPIMTKGSYSSVFKGNIKQGFNKYVKNSVDAYGLSNFQNVNPEFINDDFLKLDEMFYHQLGVGSDMYADENISLLMNEMGVAVNVNPATGEKVYILTDPMKNDDINLNLEMATKFYTMSMTKLRKYESEILPIMNSLRAQLYFEKNFKEADEEYINNVIKFFNEYKKMAIDNRPELVGNIGGINIDKVVGTSLNLMYAATMTANINVALLSEVSNMISMNIEGITSSIMNRLTKKESPIFSAGDLTKAHGIFMNMTHRNGFAYSVALLEKYQMLNQQDYEVIMHKINMVHGKPFTDRFWSGIGNWAADIHARAIVLMAQMIKEGTLDAHVYNKETGEIEYNEDLDKRFGNPADRTEKQKALLQAYKHQLSVDGIINSPAEKMTRAYGYNESRKFEFIATHYAIGAYTNKAKMLIGNKVYGRLLMSFQYYLMTKLHMATSATKSLDEGGGIEVIQDERGQWITKKQRLIYEGYTTTIVKHVMRLFTNPRMAFRDLTDIEKRNLTKLSVMATAMIIGKILYNMVMLSDDDDEKGYLKEKKIFTPLNKSLNSIFILPALIDFAKSPIAISKIFSSYLFDPVGRFNIFQNYPFRSQIKQFVDVYDMINPIEDPVQ